GEKGIFILAPMVGKRSAKDVATDEPSEDATSEGQRTLKPAIATASAVNTSRPLTGNRLMAGLEFSSRVEVATLMRSKVVSDHLAVFHHESNSFQFSNVGDRVSGNGDEIRKFAWLNPAHAVLPTQHFRRVGRHRTN